MYPMLTEATRSVLVYFLEINMTSKICNAVASASVLLVS